MEKRVYFLKFNKKILTIDLLSVLFGVIGTVLGILSLIALEPFWDNKKAAVWITIVAIIFDTASFCLAFSAFFLMFSLIRIKKDMIKQNMRLYFKDWLSIWCDFSSFLVGLVGTICEIISIIVLIPKWEDEKLSYQYTISAVVFDGFSAILGIIATLITVNIIKNYRLRGNSIF